MAASRNLWTIVLAAGEGARVRCLTRGPGGASVPKQFWCFDGGPSLLGRALCRAARITPFDRVIPVVARHHRQWWTSEFAAVPPANVMVQSVNRGTATGLLLPLLKLLFHELDPIVVVLPSDHYVRDEGPLEEALRNAIVAAEAEPESVVLLGIEPHAADPEYGWVLPAAGGGDGAVPIASFVEKPDLAAARELMRRGALWNSFMFVASARALLALYEEAQPELIEACVFFLRSGEWNPGALGALEWKLPPRDFSRDVLEHVAGRLRVLKVPSCGWSDLGTPARLSAWMAGHEPALSLAGQSPALIDAATGAEHLPLARPA